MFQRAKSSTFAALLLAVSFGTLGAVLVKHHAAGLGLAFAMVRLGVSAPFALALLARQGKQRVRFVLTNRLIAVGGWFWGLGVLTFFYGASRTSSLNTGLIAALGPIVTLIIGAAFFKDRVGRATTLQWVLACVATFATAIAIALSATGSEADRVGDVLVAASVVFGTVFFLIASTLVPTLGARDVVLGSSPYAASIAVPVALLSGQAGSMTWALVAAGCVAAVGGTLMNFLQTWATSRVHPGTVALSQLVQPLQLAIIGSVFFDETIALSQAFAGAIALACVAVLTKQRNELAPAAE